MEDDGEDGEEEVEAAVTPAQWCCHITGILEGKAASQKYGCGPWP